MEKRSSFLLFVLVSCLLGLATGHPPTTFETYVTQLNGSFPYPVFQAGRTNRIPFVIRDLLNGSAFVPFNRLVSMHGKYMHVLLTSPDLEDIYHLHPDDFGSLQSMSDAGAYYIDCFLPKSGAWYLTVTFVYEWGNDLREGKGSDYAQAVGGVAPNPDPTFTYEATKKFRSYPLPAGGFNEMVSTLNNTDPNGYEVTLSFKSGRPLSNVSAVCQPFFFTVKNPDGTLCRSMVPYLGAAAHLSVAAYEDTVYHSHSTHLTDAGYDDMVAVLKLMGSMTMDNAGNDYDMIAAMNLEMLGVQTNGTLTCVLDAAKVMRKMAMNFDDFYGIVPFGPGLVGVFDFPVTTNWRLWIYFAVNTTAGVQLIVADFGIRAFIEMPPPPPSSMDGSASTAAFLQASAMISLLLSLLFF